MKISKDILEQYGIPPSVIKIPKSNLRFDELIDLLERDCKRFKTKCDLYQSSNDYDVKMDCIDIAATKINDITQIFKDIVIALTDDNKNNNKSLRFCIRNYQSLIPDLTDYESKFLDNLLLRNEIIHDYFNRDIHYDELIDIMINYSQGAIDLVSHIKKYCVENNLLDNYVNKYSNSNYEKDISD